MKAIQMTKFGSAEVLNYVDVADPVPGSDEIVIRVESAAVNFMDVMTRRGDEVVQPTPLPFTPGYEVAGVIAATGEGAHGMEIGTRVIAMTRRGYAEYAIASANKVVPIPPGVDIDIAASLMSAGVAATLLVTESAKLMPGESIFVPAAGGGMGSYVVQIAKAVGASPIIAGASTAEKRRAALDMGADEAIDYRVSDWPNEVKRLTGGKGVDVALDMIGPAHLSTTATALAVFGRLIEYGAVSGYSGRVDGAVLESMMYAAGHSQSLINFNVADFFALRPAAAMEAMNRLLRWLANGSVAGPAIHALPLSDAARAHQLLESGSSIGKLILKP